MLDADQFKVEEQCSFLIAFYQLQKIIPLYNVEEVKFSILKTRVDMHLGSDVYECKMNSKVEEFPALRDVKFDNPFSLGGYIPYIRQALKTVGNDTLRPAMNCVCLQFLNGMVHIASTDTSMLYSVVTDHKNGELPEPVLFSSKSIKALLSFITDDAELSQDNNQYAVRSGAVKMIVNRTEGSYPAYHAIIPQRNSNVTASKAVLVDAFTKCSLNTIASKEVELKFSADAISFKSVDPDKGLTIEGSIPAAVTGDIEPIMLNAASMLKVLSQNSTDVANLSFAGPTKPIVLRDENQTEYTGILMPLLKQ